MTAPDPTQLPYADPSVRLVFPPPRFEDPRPVARRTLFFWGIVVTLAYALLWSPWWYPLSDSSLYLSLARSLAHGRGFTFQGDAHRLVPPLAPFVLSLVMRAGGGMGAIQAVLTTLMLLSHVLCFLTLRRWVTERLALTAVLASALSYWVFYNAFTVMSEPPCLALFWGGMFALSGVAMAPSRSGRWVRVVLACLLLLGAMECRMAAVFLVPGTVAALVLTGSKVEKLPTRIAWGFVFLLVFGAALAYFRWPSKVKYLIGLGPAPTTATTTQPVPAGINAEYGMDDSGNTVREGRYKSVWLYGVKRDARHLVTDVPALAGEWITEGLAMPAVVLFRGHGILRETARLLTIAVFILSLVGFGVVAWRRQWWIVGLMPYFLVFWLQWGTRIKPRYMAPITPLLFILLWTGITATLARLRRKTDGDHVRLGRLVAGVIVVGVVIGNAPAWAMEFYIRHGTPRQFYDVARQGALAELVDIGAYLQDHMRNDETLWVNVGANRRIIHFLSGRKVDVPIVFGRNRIAEVTLDNWNEPQPTNPDGTPGQTHLDIYFHRLPATARFALAYAEPQPWPDWHWPLRPAPKPEGKEWWRLYERGADGKFHRVTVPERRDYVRPIPHAGV